MSQEWLAILAILCTEKDMIEHNDIDTVISDFASKIASRIVLYEHLDIK
jgi:hypothetical protein